MKSRNSSAAVLALTLFALGVVAVAPASAQLSDPLGRLLSSTVCSGVELPVALTEASTTRHRIVGQLCSKLPMRNRTVHVLVSGATYGSVYWDFPLRRETYSYVKAFTDAGYATLNLDRIGIGRSDHPSPDQVTMEANAFVIHQVVQMLRSGAIGHTAFSRVILVGHSVGSAIATLEASTYGDVDGLIVTGLLHTFGPTFAALPAALYPARDDPRFTGRDLPSDYQTTRPGTRGPLFYWLPGTDADVVALDEATKETVTTAEGMGFVGLFAQPEVTRGIRVPVLVVVGQFDTGFCTPPACPEALVEPVFYSDDARAEVHVIADAGHDLNLHRNTQGWFTIARDWLARHYSP